MERKSKSNKIVPYSCVEGTRDVRDDVFGERDLQRHIGKHLDIRSRLKLAASHPVYYAVGKDDIKKAYQRKTKYITKKVFSNHMLQDYVGSYLSPVDRAGVRQATKTTNTNNLWGERPYWDDIGMRFLKNKSRPPALPAKQKSDRNLIHGYLHPPIVEDA